MKVIKSLENRGIFLKGTTRKITNKEVGFLNFLRPLMTAGINLLPFGLSVGMSAADAVIQKKKKKIIDQAKQYH